MATSLPPATASYCAAVCVLSILGLVAKDARNVFSLTPGNTFLGEYHVWNMLTGGLMETSVVKVCAGGRGRGSGARAVKLEGAGGSVCARVCHANAATLCVW